MILAAVEVGPQLGLILMTLVTGIISAVTSYLAFKVSTANKKAVEENKEATEKLNVKTEKAGVDIASIHKAVNSTASALATDAKVNEAKMEALQLQLLEVSKQLAQSKGERAAQPVGVPTPSPTTPTLVPAEKVQEIAVKVTGMEVERMTVDKMLKATEEKK